ncbi:glutamyl-tRNA reductase [Halovivax gelatinilyticus]|uniref:glutamyl-tRNA reductase n=1 Tax=Halovivax gelatinilyticus TaxID=2961597 RepID=UPI0020CA7B15|nr:glutamyl-tRNA reductase [Halovivax gelatinilyticus]
MSANGVVTSARVTHETATVDELAEASPENQHAGVTSLLSAPDVTEAFVLATCNRVEAYVVTQTADAGYDALDTFFEAAPESIVATADHESSLRHLLRVACGLDSVVLGEDQIIGQVRDAYQDARRGGAIGELLDSVVTKAIHVGERARTETEINEGIVSLGSAAVELAAESIDLSGADALVVGAGEMGRLAVRALESSDVATVSIANRTVERARSIVETHEIDGEVYSLEALTEAARSADVIVTATGSADPVLGPTDLGRREQVVVDLGQPRDVDPSAGRRRGVTVYDLDDLETITRETRRQRQTASNAVERMVDDEFELLLTQIKRNRADDVIAAMYEGADRIKTRELETAIGRLDERDPLTDEQREIVETMADAIVGQLLAAPTESLREAAVADDWETIDTALRLFDPATDVAHTRSERGVADQRVGSVGTAEDD